jgi:hypothetical protein
MTPSHAQYNMAVAAKLQGWLRRQSRRLPAAWQEAAFVLLRVDLDPAPPCSAPSTPPAPAAARPTTRCVS